MIGDRKPLTRFEGVAVPMARDNVDTDAIIPSVGVRACGSDVAGLGRYLFHELRHDAQTRPVAGFELDRPEYARASILVAGHNFGCGSSREHAVWALEGYGFRAVVASSFGEIFQGNCVRNGLLPACLPEPALSRLREAVAAIAGAAPLSVDVQAGTITLPDGERFRFELDAAAREMLVKGLDEIDLTLQRMDRIRAFQREHARARPWIYEIESERGPGR